MRDGDCAQRTTWGMPEMHNADSRLAAVSYALSGLGLGFGDETLKLAGIIGLTILYGRLSFADAIQASARLRSLSRGVRAWVRMVQRTGGAWMLRHRMAWFTSAILMSAWAGALIDVAGVIDLPWLHMPAQTAGAPATISV